MTLDLLLIAVFAAGLLAGAIGGVCWYRRGVAR